MSRIVIGFDGGDGGRDALALGRFLTGPDDELVVGAALPYDPVPMIDVSGYDRALAEHYDSLFGEVERELGDRPFARRELRDSSPPRALSSLAETEGADLVVVGSTHRGKLGRVFPGAVGERLLNGSPCAVAIAPRGFANRDHRPVGVIGVGYDGTGESRQALAAAQELRARLDCGLSLITVIPHPEAFSRELVHASPELAATASELLGTDAYREALRQHFRGILDDGLEQLDGDDGVETTLDEGSPAAALAARGVELDLLVLGSRGYGPIRRVLLGGVSAEVMRTAPCPVIVVPRPPEQ